MGLRERTDVGGIGIDPVTEADVVNDVLAALERGEGGRIVTPNVDILRLARSDPAVRAYLDGATLVVADGMPLVWASRLARTPLPGRVPGSSLIWTLSYHLGLAGRSVYLLGGTPGEDGAGGDGPDEGGTGADGDGADGADGADGDGLGGCGARRAAAVLSAACPGLRIAGWASPPYGFEEDPQRYAAVRAAVVEAKPDLVFVGLGFPKQERVIDALRTELPLSWFLGCGAAVSFVAGDAARAPSWMQRVGLEWAWRLAGDPRRLAGRYLWHDLPYALRLLAGAAMPFAARRKPPQAMRGEQHRGQ